MSITVTGQLLSRSLLARVVDAVVGDRWALGVMLWRAGRWRAVLVVGSAVSMGLVGTVTILLSGVLIAAVPGAAREGLDSAQGHHVLLALAAVAALSLAYAGLSPVSGGRLSAGYVLAVRETLARVMLAPPGIDHLRDPKTAGEIAALEEVDEAGVQANIGLPLIAVLSSWTGGLGAAALLVAFHWWAPVVLVCGWVVVNRSFRAWVRQAADTFFGTGTAGLRRSAYLRGLATQPGPAKELRVFGLAGWAVAQFITTWQDAMHLVWRQRRAGSRTWLVGIAAVVVTHGIVLSALGVAAAQGQLGIGPLTVYGQAVLGTAALGLMSDFPLYLGRAAAADARLLDLERRIASPRPDSDRSAVSAPQETPEAELRFEGVRFGYPGQERAVLDDLNLVIPYGQSLAVVGENGAGKSTMIRLLCGLYSPDSGRILAGGADLAKMDPGAWRAGLGVIFQDFVRYQVSLADNVGLACLPLHENREALRRALDKAGGSQLVDDLPWGWDTILASGYERGADLSGGQWQKVALARAMLAVEGGARFLVLDEPTANLDVRAEIELFDRFIELTAGVTTILVSHRLSSVRRAERIVVLEAGRIVEDGSHDQLMELDGRYARMFRLQAQRFQEAPGD